ncbi:uncharacterized protein GGS22DRAFT_156833 [Annulohypoxylon maeteangense]|uniref:uncharacterized protein n=1 Tax=Annulohypoxylon maeteangense TaxID=1927788 RepID=UPI0020079582|nr:uncharacterized protein GGS22DRAFT_156833 [Annulohypoxylon maeteangense]KAI0887347.1 hypothetical protein GGS22DRAFT_156833 [Annulohypoxylon maeteangense]
MVQDERIDKWKSQGILEPSCIWDRLEVEEAIVPDPEKVPSGIKELNESAFISLLCSKGGLPQSCEDFGRLIYSVVAYLSATPFYHPPNEKVPPSLSLSEIYRGLAWILPGVSRRVIGADGSSRSRTVADHRRLLFQSLATTTHSGSFDPIETQKRAIYNAHFEPDAFYGNSDWLFVNRDDDGDEIYHDVLDVLHTIQPEPNYPYAGVRRDGFREFAKTLAKGLPKFDTLAIPLDRFTTFVTFLLALQFEHKTPGEPIPSQYEEAARNITASFCEDAKLGIITWPKFDDALKQMPFLFDPLHRIISTAFLKEQPFSISGDWIAPTPPKDSFMTLPRLSQLATMINQDVDFESFGRAHQWHTGIRPTAGVLANFMKTMPDLSILAMYGLTSAGEKYIFGIFKPLLLEKEKETAGEESLREAPDEEDEEQRKPVVREMDPIHDWVEFRGTIRFPARPILFVLSPTQHVVRFKDEPRVVDDHLHFGDALTISNDGTASIGTGDTAILIKTKAIEIWGETSAET